MGMLEMFKEQLERESRAIGEARNLKKRGDYLIWWYFLKLGGLPESEVEDIVTDGFGDHGIDALRIDETDNTVHFYNFKNPEDKADAFPSGEVDKLLGGLRLITTGKLHTAKPNAALKRQLEAVQAAVRSGYRVHLVTSGTGCQDDVRAKLDAFIASMKAPEDSFTWNFADIDELQKEFYRRSRPTIEDVYEVATDQPPYITRAALHDCFMFTMSGSALAALFDKYGEALLQQNLRVGQGEKGTNAQIRRTAMGDDSGNFLHYNNGVVFLADNAAYDPVTRVMRLNRYQVVNGGQTIRSLSAARESLKPDVVVAVRVITFGEDKTFAGNVTVNLNNQNRIKDSFLRATDPGVIQLAAALLAKGWYLERREREVGTLNAGEVAAIEARLNGASLADRTISLTGGLQAYVATYMGDPQLAKKYPKQMFASVSDGGHFESIIKDLTADKAILAHRLRSAVEAYVSRFESLKRRKGRVPSRQWRGDYVALLGPELSKVRAQKLEVAIPPSGIFLSATVFLQWTMGKKGDPGELVDGLERGECAALNEGMLTILKARSDLSETQSWQTLLKSQTLFNAVKSHLKHIMKQPSRRH